jgi:hypothetical protein
MSERETKYESGKSIVSINHEGEREGRKSELVQQNRWIIIYCYGGSLTRFSSFYLASLLCTWKIILIVSLNAAWAFAREVELKENQKTRKHFINFDGLMRIVSDAILTKLLLFFLNRYFYFAVLELSTLKEKKRIKTKKFLHSIFSCEEET